MRTLYTPDALLDTSPAGLRLLQRCEGFRSRWYLCPADYWTIGYGMREGILPGLTRDRIEKVTEGEAERHLCRLLIQTFEPVVERAVKVELSQGEFDALTDFSYNVGGANFRGSTLLRKLNRGDRAGAAAEFDRWVYGGGRVLPGLVKRRAAERALFESRDAASVGGEAFASIMADLEPVPVLPVLPLPYRLPSLALRTINRL